MKIPFLVKADPNCIKERKDQKVPFIIHQTMKSENVPINMYKAAKSWIDLNREYEYRFCNDKKCSDFLLNNFPKRVYIAHSMLYAGAAKSDLWRLCVLYVHGGVYSDIDTIAKVPLSKIIKNDDDFISLKAKYLHKNITQKKIILQNAKITNAFIATVPKHPLILETINNIVHKIFYLLNNKINQQKPQSITGPLILGQTFNSLLKINIWCEIKNKTYIIQDKKVRLFLLSNKKYFDFRYENYKNDCIKMNIKDYHGKNGSYAFYYDYAEMIYNKLTSKP